MTQHILNDASMDEWRAIKAERDRLRKINAELLAALKQIADHPRDVTGAPAMVEIARAAIARAEGSDR